MGQPAREGNEETQCCPHYQEPFKNFNSKYYDQDALFQ